MSLLLLYLGMHQPKEESANLLTQCQVKHTRQTIQTKAFDFSPKRFQFTTCNYSLATAIQTSCLFWFQVSHHPMVVACHCDGTGWKFWADSNLKSKFWGRSIQLDPVGVLTLQFDDGEILQWSKVPIKFTKQLSILYVLRSLITISIGDYINIQPYTW